MYNFYLADCQWGQWGEYGQCDGKQCTKFRSRTIKRKADGGIACQREDGINSTACPCEDEGKTENCLNFVWIPIIKFLVSSKRLEVFKKILSLASTFSNIKWEIITTL